MNWKAHPPGNVSAQAPNQTNQYLCGRSPINEMVLSHNLIQNQNHQNNHWRNHPNVGQIRDTMRNTVYESLLKHKKASSWGPTRMENMAICFENILLTRIAVSMEDYLNMEKLEDRLEWLILKMKKQFGAWNIMAPTVGVVSSSGSASNNGSSQGFPVMSLASCDQMNPACSTAYSSGYGSSLYEAVKPFYNGHICSGVCSTTLHGHPSSYGFSNGSSNGFLTNAGSNVGYNNVSKHILFAKQYLNLTCSQTQPMQNFQQSQQQTSTCMQTQPMQHRLQSQQLSVSGSFLLNGVSASTSTTDGSKYYGRADNDADSGTREAPSDDMSEDLENSRQYSDLAKQYNGTRQSYNDAWTVTNNTLEDILNPRKYLKVESFNGTSRLRAPSIDQPCLRQGLPIVKQEFEESKPFTPKIEEVKKDFSRSSSETHALVNEIGKDFSEGSPEVKPSGDSASMKEIATCSNQGDAHVDTKFNYAKTEIEPEVTAVMADHVDRKNSEKQTMKVITLTETFTSEQIKEHIASLKLWVGQVDFSKSLNMLLMLF
ncbi:hypothetical protein GIB67_036244 [Kingdonia uniflora]|uniref:Uncharacterized protein n=1 Tax=Kingdonia uniflora TaxID=39325 RepID=A0A7J7NTU6_9MAGN|nr:hypothetical protein GIB67_036244 [Kingdonia uniflora]